MIDLSQEIRVLNTTAELIENSVNNLICTFFTNEFNIVIEVKPNDIIEKKYFFILLLEIISPVNREMIPGKKQNDNLLTILNRICKNPILRNDSANSKLLASKCTDFIDWLDHKGKTGTELFCFYYVTFDLTSTDHQKAICLPSQNIYI